MYRTYYALAKVIVKPDGFTISFHVNNKRR
jgi:hypothetical protein